MGYASYLEDTKERLVGHLTKPLLSGGRISSGMKEIQNVQQKVAKIVDVEFTQLREYEGYAEILTDPNIDLAKELIATRKEKADLETQINNLNMKVLQREKDIEELKHDILGHHGDVEYLKRHNDALISKNLELFNENKALKKALGPDGV